MSDITTFQRKTWQETSGDLIVVVRNIIRTSGTPLSDGVSYGALGTLTIAGAGVDIGNTEITVDNTFTLYGNIVDDDAMAVEDVVVVVTGAYLGNGLTDINGDFTVYSLYAGDFTLTCSLDGYITDVVEATIIDVNKEKNAVVDRVLVSGNITVDAAPLNAVTMAITGMGNTSTDASGNYAFDTVLDGERTITPTKAGYEFVPVTIDVIIDRAHDIDNDFVGTAVSSTVDIDVDNAGMVQKLAAVGGGYPAVRDADPGSTTSSTYLHVGQVDTGVNFIVRRTFMAFTIPAATEIVSCSLFLWGDIAPGDTHFEIFIHPSTYTPPISTDDFPDFDGREVGVGHSGDILNDSFATQTDFVVDGWNEIVFDSVGLAAILVAQGGTLKIALISDQDYDNSEPTNDEAVRFSTAVGEEPYLHLTYV